MIRDPVPVRVIRLLTGLYPREFRTRFGGSIVADFTALYREQRKTGAGRGLRFTWATAADIVRAAIAERLRRSAGQPMHSPTRRTPIRRGDGMIHGIWQDLRFAFRSLGRQPFFTSVVALTLAMGIGTNAAIFSLVSNVLWRDLPYPEPQRLVSAWTSNLARGFNRWGVSLHDYTDWRERSDVFASLGAYNINTINLSGIEQPQRVAYAQVTPDFFTTLGTPPQLGRFFANEENLPGRDGVVILSHGFWREMLGARNDVIGRTVVLDGVSMVVVGVMPDGFTFPSPNVRLWKPFGMRVEEEGTRGGRWVRAIGRLEQGVSLESARVALTALGTTLAAEYPETNEGFGIYIEPLLTTSVTGVQSALFILWGTTGLLLLIVCANVANMMLARSATRSRETAVRAALGASKARLLWQLLSEGIPLTALGCALGIAVATVLIQILPSLLAQQVPRLNEVSLDGGVLAYSIAVAGVVGLIFSIVPAFRSAGLQLSSSLHDSRGASQSTGAVRTRNAIVVTQIALAMAVVVGAGLMVKSLAELMKADPGFSPEHLLTVRLSPSWREMPERGQAVQLFDQLVESTAALPGVQEVSAINSLPLTGNSWNTTVEMVGRNAAATGSEPRGLNRVILPNYHQTMGIPLLRGRYLQPSDDARSAPVVVINRAAAETWWPGEDPIGAMIRYDGPDPRTVVGVVGDVEPTGLGGSVPPMLYVPFEQGRFGHFQNWGMSFVIRTAGDPVDIMPGIVERMAAVANPVPVYSALTMEEVVAANVSTQRLYTQLLTVFGAVALSLATLGVYSVISYLVAQRTREIGVRMALGAAAPKVLKLIVSRALTLALIGIVAGSIIATVVSRALTSFLYQTSPIDPVTYAAAGLTFALAVVLASIEPAFRAMRVDPVVALRSE